MKFIDEYSTQSLFLSNNSNFFYAGIPGHTSTIFCGYCFICIHFQNIYLKAWGFIIALMVGLSRIVVGAHWPLDIFSGMIIGWMIPIYSYVYLNSKRLSQSHILQNFLILVCILSAATLLMVDINMSQNSLILKNIIALFNLTYGSISFFCRWRNK